MSDSVTLWTAACQHFLSITNSWSPPKPMSIKSVMPSNHLILCRLLLLLPSIFPSIWVFSMSQLFTSGGQSIRVSASTSVNNTSKHMQFQFWSPTMGQCPAEHSACTVSFNPHNNNLWGRYHCDSRSEMRKLKQINAKWFVQDLTVHNRQY